MCKKKYVENAIGAQGYKLPGRHCLSRKGETVPGRETAHTLTKKYEKAWHIGGRVGNSK